MVGTNLERLLDLVIDLPHRLMCTEDDIIKEKTTKQEREDKTMTNKNLTIVIENATTEVESLRELRKHLDRRIKQYEAWIEVRKARILQDPTDNVITKELHFIHEYERQLDCLHVISREAKFDIENITGEEEK